MTTEPMARFEPRASESWRDPFGMYAALRDHDPVHHVEDGDYWVLSRFRDVFDAAVDFGSFSSAKGLTFAYGDMEAMDIEAPIVMMDPPNHTGLRKLAVKRFTPRQVQALEPLIRSFVVERIERLREMGEGDIIEHLFKPLPSLVVADFLGVPQAERGRFDGWTDAIVAANSEGDILQAPSAVGELFAYFAGLIEERRKEPRDDMLSALVHGKLTGAEVPPAQILGFAFTMVTGGNDTMTGLLGGSAELLTRYPEQRQHLLKDPSLLPGAIEEFLRLTSPVQGLARTLTCDVTLEGGTLPAGRKVMLLYASANRDEREFGPDAGVPDVRRKMRRHLSFSYGAHHCIGAAAARLQARVTLEELLSRCPDFVVDADAGQYASGHFVRRFTQLPFRANA